MFMFMVRVITRDELENEEICLGFLESLEESYHALRGGHEYEMLDPDLGITTRMRNGSYLELVTLEFNVRALLEFSPIEAFLLDLLSAIEAELDSRTVEV